MFYACYDMLDSSRLSTLSCIHIRPLLRSLHCAVTLTMFPPPLYLPRFIPSASLLPAFVNVFFNTFQSLSRRIISVPLISATHLRLLSVLAKVETLSGIE